MFRTKDKFIKEMTETLKSMPLEKREKFLNKVEYDWLSSIKAKLKKDLKNYWFCQKCKKYIRYKDTEKVSRTEILHGVLISSDSGYGDDDILGDVEYLIHSFVCPNCGNKQDSEKKYIRTIKQWTRT